MDKSCSTCYFISGLSRRKHILQLSTKGFLQYCVGGTCSVAGLALMLPLASLGFGWDFALRFEPNHTVTLWDAVNLANDGFKNYVLLAIFAGVVLSKGGLILLFLGRRNMNLAEGKQKCRK